MEDKNRSDFIEIVNKLSERKIVLPDFQREFVWRSEEQQRKLVASVLTRMPIGSILLLLSKPDEYASKIIGCSNEQDMSDVAGEVEFLLDGQQRVTVLANVFSSIIHELCPKVSDLSAPMALKRRFFLRVPKWTKSRAEKDLFGVHELQFKYNNVKKDPDFLSGDIYNFVECVPFKANDDMPYNPQKALSTELDSFCISGDDGYLIPLYLLAASKNTNRGQVMLRYNSILTKIAQGIYDEIINHFTGLANDDERKQFVDELILDEDTRNKIKTNLGLFEGIMDDRRQIWQMDMDAYLKACVQDMALNRIVVGADQRTRAIDIYENLNRGGVSLSTFDLIMARVAKVSKENFYKRLINSMKSPKQYQRSLLPDKIDSVLGNKIDNGKYNATINCNCYNESKNEIVSKYVDAFLDVLSLYCNNKDFTPEMFKLDNIKREQILQLEPTDIDGNCEMICNAIDRALFFFQTRCGIRNITEINYQLMLVLVATIFIKDEFFNDKQVHNKLEAWYWAVLFSGEYDKDQNSTMISNLQMMIKMIKKQQDTKWLKGICDYVLVAQNFSDEKLLLLEKADDERYPKDVIRHFICQYYLAKTYADMFDASKTISVFMDDSDQLEAHHIIPLGTVTKYGETTAALRGNRKHICNSPLNFVYITKQSNKAISDDSLDVYAQKLCSQARSALMISKYSAYSDGDTEDKIKAILKDRYDYLEGDIKQHISDLLL